MALTSDLQEYETPQTLFIERETGSELVVNGSNSQSAVTNMEQLQNAIRRCMENIEINIGGEEVDYGING